MPTRGINRKVCSMLLICYFLRSSRLSLCVLLYLCGEYIVLKSNLSSKQRFPTGCGFELRASAARKRAAFLETDRSDLCFSSPPFCLLTDIYTHTRKGKTVYEAAANSCSLQPGIVRPKSTDSLIFGLQLALTQ